MPAAIALREDFSAADLRALARQSRDTRQCRRLLALAAVAEGRGRTEAAEIGGMDRQTLRDWVHRFNDEGPEGLLDRKTDGPPPKLTAEQKAELAAIVEAGPDQWETGLVRWRRVDLKAEIETRFGVVYHERSVSRLLHELGFSHMSARPYHPAQKAEVLEDFKKTSRVRSPHP
jgi:transposase